MRYRTESQVRLKNGIRGAAGAALIAGIIDGLFQALSDIGKCFSNAEHIYRVAIATALGIVGGLVASAAFLGFAMLVALPALGISAAGAVLIPALAGVGVGLWAGIFANHLKEDYLFDAFPH